jgi:hypothetical protein
MKSLVTSIAGVALCSVALAQTPADIAGSKDHPLVSRYTGAQLNAYFEEAYTEVEIVRAQRPAAGSGLNYGDPIGGRLIGFSYIAPPKRTPLEVFRNYEQALTRGGFTILYKCELERCAERRVNGQGTYASDVIQRRFDQDWATLPPSVEWTDSPSYFLSAQLKRAAGDAYVIL